jgi:triosephosphate isomerase (TIM)
MRRKIVAGNWKMNLNLEEGANLVNSILLGMPQLGVGKQVIFAPPFTHITLVGKQISGRASVMLGAQNCHHEVSGAYTGEVSAKMLSNAGVQYVIIGHSERREYCAETDALLAKKVTAALSEGMDVIFCCGEPLAIREAGTQQQYVEAQIKAGLFHLSAEQMQHIVIAYEPIWAIGTGKTATSQQAQDMHADIRAVIAAHFGAETAQNTSILYGGSCNPTNAAEIFACADVDGGLIGGASLKADAFLSIIKAL